MQTAPDTSLLGALSHVLLCLRSTCGHAGMDLDVHAQPVSLVAPSGQRYTCQSLFLAPPTGPGSRRFRPM